ncbi:MAG: ferritin-like domain-containing protein [Cytophagales bacterium]|nr:ferritin-like domain-containing protein [Cytophagales bacterium]
MKTLEDLFEHELKDLYSAEKQFIEAMPKMMQSASDSRLKRVFENHLEQTKAQKQRLEQVFELCGLSTGRKKCEAVAGMIEESQTLIDEKAKPEVKDAGLIAAAQRMEHYEISAYGTARHFAERLGKQEAAQLLAQTLEEEQKADTLLNELAKNYVNEKAMAAG